MKDALVKSRRIFLLAGLPVAAAAAILTTGGLFKARLQSPRRTGSRESTKRIAAIVNRFGGEFGGTQGRIS